MRLVALAAVALCAAPASAADLEARIAPLAKAHKGRVAVAVKQAVGKAAGDSKLEAEGKADKVEGKVQNAVGGAKDAVKDAANR